MLIIVIYIGAEGEGHFTGQLWNTQGSQSNNRGFESKERLIVPWPFCIWPPDFKHFQIVIQNCNWANSALKSAIRNTQTHSNTRPQKTQLWHIPRKSADVELQLVVAISHCYGDLRFKVVSIVFKLNFRNYSTPSKQVIQKE
uniref:Uncharacterized protein n=1 Tax=Molossus molossus TaxID=27622 RepID=A0A7J8I134_MOLMO|nr:hypothetical protein HJG59_010873 [Molossus molossus]